MWSKQLGQNAVPNVVLPILTFTKVIHRTSVCPLGHREDIRWAK